MGNYPTSDLYYDKSVERRKAKFARAIRKIRGENKTGLEFLDRSELDSLWCCKLSKSALKPPDFYLYMDFS